MTKPKNKSAAPVGTVFSISTKKKFRNAVLFTGLPGIGLVGKLCTDYLLKQLNAKRIGEVYSDSFPPAVHTRDSVIELIRDEVFAVRFKNRDYLFLAGPVQPALDMRFAKSQDHYEFAGAIASMAKQLGVKRIYTLAGINVGEARLTRPPRIVVAATHASVVSEFVKLGAVTSSQDGLISGVAGLVLGVAKQQGLEGACLMGETNSNLVYGDHSAAKKLLEMLVAKFGFSVQMEAIEKESKNIEKAFNTLSKEIEAQQKELEDEPPGASGLSYVR